MSHEIDDTTGRNAIAFKGEVPWHGLGVNKTPGASIESWITDAGLGYTVEKAELFASIPHGQDDATLAAVHNRCGLYRTDTGAVLGIASKTHHKIVQPREVVEFFRDLIEEAGFELEVAGAIRGGARVWALARAGKEFTVGGTDIVRPYLLLSTVFDNLRSTLAQYTSVRVVCNNTLTMAYAEQDGDAEKKVKTYVSIPHSRHFNANAVKAELQLVTKAAEQFKEQAKALASRKVTHEEAVAYVQTLFMKKGKDGSPTTKSLEVMAGVIEAIEKGPGSTLKTAKDTAWGLLNGVTHFLDFKANSRTGNEGRLNNAWFGDAARLKAKAKANAMALVTV